MFGLYSGIGVLPAMVSPWCDNGDIKTYLKSKEGSSTFDALRLLLLVHILQGLQYLHCYNPVIVHGDLKGANILVSDDGIARLCDFGFAKVLAEVSASLTSQSTLKGTLRWMAPELFDEGDAGHTIWSDIWAFGCVLYEIFSGVVPYHRIRNEQGVIIALHQRLVPDIPEKVPESVHAILNGCWALKPSSRIDIQRLLSRIHKLAVSEVAALLLLQGMSSNSLLEDHIDLLQAWNRSISEPYRLGDSPIAADHLCNTLNLCIEHSSLLPLDRMMVTVRTLLESINETYDTTLRRSAQELKRFASLLGQADASLAVQFLRRFSTRLIATLPCHSNAVSHVVWTPCGSRLLSSSYDGTVRMWDPDMGIEVFSCTQTRAILVDNVAISSDSRFIAAASADYGLQVWDSATGVSYDRELPGDKILWLFFTRQDRCVITATRDAVLYWEFEAHPTSPYLIPIVSPYDDNRDILVESEFVALACHDDNAYVRIAYSLSSAVGLWVHSFDGNITWRLSDTHKASHIAWSSDTKLLVCFSAAADALYVLETYNRDIGPKLFHGQPAGVTSVAFSRDNRCVAAGSMDNSLRIWNVMLRHCTLVLKHPSLLKGVSSISYSPDGSYIAAGSYDGTVHIWDIDDRVWLRYDGDQSRSAYPACSTATARWDDANHAFARYPRDGMKWPQRSFAASRKDDRDAQRRAKEMPSPIPSLSDDDRGDAQRGAKQMPSLIPSPSDDVIWGVAV